MWLKLFCLIPLISNVMIEYVILFFQTVKVHLTGTKMFVVGGDGVVVVVVVSILYNDVICNLIKTPRFSLYFFFRFF